MNASTATVTAAPIPDARISDYFALLKPRVMSLVVFSGVVGMMAAPGHIHPFLALVAMAALAVGAGAAGAINMWYDRDIDAVMRRTMDRPIPTGRVVSGEALGPGIVLSIASVIVMMLAANWVAAALLALANLFYVFVYTLWLKRLTPQNIVIGGAAGAFPPMIGWAAVTGDVSLYPVLMFLMIFFWTPPHFWALSLFASDDYRRAGVPMLPVTSGARVTKIHMLVYTILLVPLTIAPWFFGFEGTAYAAAAAGLSGLFLISAVRVLISDDLGRARLMFGYSVFYLFALFLAILLL